MTETQTSDEHNLTHTNSMKYKQPNSDEMEKKFIEKKQKIKYLVID